MLNEYNIDSDIRVDDVLVVPVWDDDDSAGRGWYTDAKCSSCSSVRTWSELVLSSSSSSVICDEEPSLDFLWWVLENMFFVCWSESITKIGGGGCCEVRRNWSLKFVGVVSSPSGDDRPLVLAKIPAGNASVRSKHERSNCSGRFNRFNTGILGDAIGLVLIGDGGNWS